MRKLQSEKPRVDPLAWALEVAATLPTDDDEASLALRYLNEIASRYRLGFGERGERFRALEDANNSAVTLWLNPLVSPK